MAIATEIFDASHEQAHAPAGPPGGNSPDRGADRSDDDAAFIDQIRGLVTRVVASADHWGRFAAHEAARSAPEALRPGADDPFARSDLVHVTHLTSRADQAALLLSAAFAEANVGDFRPARTRGLPPGSKASTDWYKAVVDGGLSRLQEVRNALVHDWTPSRQEERLVIGAFVLLADVTPAREQLIELYKVDRPRAFQELVAHLELLEKQMRLTARLVTDAQSWGADEPSEQERFDARLEELLDRSGEVLTLTQAADRLGMSRQGLHQRIKRGTALGIMLEGELVVPTLQFKGGEGKEKVMHDIRSVLQAFDEAKAGTASALQFLVDDDPNLGCPPIGALREGRVGDVVAAARAYLGSDEQ